MGDNGIKSIFDNYWFLASIRASDQVSVIIDTEFRYVAVSLGFCNMLNKQRDELEGHEILSVFPDFEKMKNYKNLQLAMDGNEFFDTVPAITGEMFFIHYRPILHKGSIIGVHTESRKAQIADLGI